MAQNTVQQNSGGIGFCGVLLIVFITLKLTHVIDWSWTWVLSPFWIPLAFGLLMMAIVLVGVVFADSRERR